MRSGTENVPMILGFGAACQAASEGLPEKLRTMERRKQQCLQLLEEKVPQAVILGSHQAPHVISLAVPGVRSQGSLAACRKRAYMCQRLSLLQRTSESCDGGHGICTGADRTAPFG